MKAIVLVILFILIGLAIYYVPLYLRGGGTAHCPPGSRYVRVVSGGGWVDTDPSDPWGSCVSQSMIDNANNQ
jgi:hypothetical protein